ncbi:MAG: ABC transporter ATP-binding protein [Candidatus Thermoplasmatota archaeon]|nr:ABC transporter ATP-binding protein [Candidatus Thermoplasmatota archaeon]MCL5793940.1 ABC transporter ATP-binding protein [Candidatus Thermoplasmatota archaeon]
MPIHSISLENCAYGYGGKEIVSTGALEIQNGITCIIGPNGSGKTTFLRGIAGVLEPMRGKAMIDGVDLFGHRSSSVRSHIGFVPENSFPYPDMTVRQYLSYWGSLYNASQKNVEEALQRLAIVNLAERSGNALSLGQKRRVMIARLLLIEPLVMILDEPTANLDPEISLQVSRLISESGKEIPVVYSTHHLLEVEQLFDKAYFVIKGKLVGPYVREDMKTDLYSTYMELMPEAGEVPQ